MAVAERIDDATDLVIGDARLRPAGVAPRASAPSLLRHSPFNIGFFGAFGALVAVFLASSCSASPRSWSCW